MTRNVTLVQKIEVTVFRVVCRWFGCLHTSDHTDETEARLEAAGHQSGHKLAGVKSVYRQAKGEM